MSKKKSHDKVKCPECHGSGRVVGAGTGIRFYLTCFLCRGRGIITKWGQ